MGCGVISGRAGVTENTIRSSERVRAFKLRDNSPRLRTQLHEGALVRGNWTVH